MDDADPIQNAVRTKRREKRVGEDAACLLCGHEELSALTDADRSLLEDHHVAREANDGELTVPLCRNCHASVHEGIREIGQNRGEPETLLHRIYNILRILAEFFEEAAEACRRWARQLRQLIERLTNHDPNWKETLDAA